MVVKMIELNGKKYVAKEFDYNMMCDLEDYGLSIDDIVKKPLSGTRAYIGICMGVDKDVAGKEINEHIINGGTLDKIVEIFGEKVETSGFFQSQMKKADKKKSTEKTTE